MNKLVVITDVINEEPYAVVAYSETKVKAFPVSDSSSEWTEWANSSNLNIGEIRESLDYTLQAEFPRPTTEVELLHLEDILSSENLAEFKSEFGESTLELVDAVQGHGRRFASKSFQSDTSEVLTLPLSAFAPESRQAAIEYKALSFRAENRFSSTHFDAKGARALWDPNLGPSGGWRCPEGSQFGGYITDRFGRGCGGGILRRIGRGLLNAGRRLDNIGESRGKRRLERAANRAQRATGAGRAQRAQAGAVNALERGAQRLVGEFKPQNVRPGDGGRRGRRNIGKPNMPDADREAEINDRLTAIAAELDDLVDQPPTPEIEKRIRELGDENRALRIERDGATPKRVASVTPKARPRRVVAEDIGRGKRRQGKTPVKKPVAEGRREGVLERAARRLVGDYDPSEYKPGDKKRIKERENRYAKVTDNALANALELNKPGKGNRDVEANKRQERLEVLQEMLNRGIDIPEEYKKEVKQYRLKKQRQKRGRLVEPVPQRRFRPGEGLTPEEQRQLKRDIDKRSRSLSDEDLDRIIEEGPRRNIIDGNVRGAQQQRLAYEAAVRERNRRARGGRREDGVDLTPEQAEGLERGRELIERAVQKVPDKIEEPDRDKPLRDKPEAQRPNRAAEALEEAAQRVLDGDKRRNRKKTKKEQNDAFREIMQDIFREKRVRENFKDEPDWNLRRALKKLRGDRNKYNDDEDKQKRIDNAIKNIETELDNRKRLRAEASARLAQRGADARKRREDRREARRKRKEKPEEEAPEAPRSMRERTRTAVAERGVSTPIRRPQPKRVRGERIDADGMEPDQRKRLHDIMRDQKFRLDQEWRKRLGLGEDDEITSRAIKDYIKKQEADGKPNAFLGKLRADANDWDVLSEHEKNILGRPPGARMPGDENALLDRIGPKRRKEIADAMNAGAPAPKSRSARVSPQASKRRLSPSERGRLNRLNIENRPSRNEANERAKQLAKANNAPVVVYQDPDDPDNWGVAFASDFDDYLDSINDDSRVRNALGSVRVFSPEASAKPESARSVKPESRRIDGDVLDLSESARVARSIDAVNESIGGSMPDERSKRNVRNRFPKGGLPDKAFWREADWEPRPGGDDKAKHDKRFGRYYDEDGNLNARGRLVNQLIENDKRDAEFRSAVEAGDDARAISVATGKRTRTAPIDSRRESQEYAKGLKFGSKLHENRYRRAEEYARNGNLGGLDNLLAETDFLAELYQGDIDKASESRKAFYRGVLEHLQQHKLDIEKLRKAIIASPDDSIPVSTPKPLGSGMVKPGARTLIDRFDRPNYRLGWDDLDSNQKELVERAIRAVDNGDQDGIQNAIAELNDQIDRLKKNYKVDQDAGNLAKIDRLIMHRDNLSDNLEKVKQGKFVKGLDYAFELPEDRENINLARNAIIDENHALADIAMKRFEDRNDTIDYLLKRENLTPMERGRLEAQQLRILMQMDALDEARKEWNPPTPPVAPRAPRPRQPGQKITKQSLSGPRRGDIDDEKYRDIVEKVHGDARIPLSEIDDDMFVPALLDENLEAVDKNGIRSPLLDADGNEITFEELMYGAHKLKDKLEFENARFKFKAFKGNHGRDYGGVWSVFRVEDKDTGETWFIKASTYGANDGVLENVGAKMVQNLDLAVRPGDKDVRMGQVINIKGQGNSGRKARWTAMRDVSNWEINELGVEIRDAGEVMNGRKLDASDVAQLITLDFITDQMDRHSGNFMIGEDANGVQRIAIIDNGLGFGGRIHDVLGEHGREVTEDELRQFADERIKMTPRQFGYADKNGMRNRAGNMWGNIIFQFAPVEFRRRIRDNQQERDAFRAKIIETAQNLRNQLDAIYDPARFEAAGIALTDMEKIHLELAKSVAITRVETILKKPDAMIDALTRKHYERNWLGQGRWVDY